MINNLNCVFTQYVKTSPKLVVTEFNCDQTRDLGIKSARDLISNSHAM